MQARFAMNLRCKVFRAADAAELEHAINRFLGEELVGLGPVQFEEISQSEGAAGVTVVLWYSLGDELDEVLDDEDTSAEPPGELGQNELA
jgi:hypothetical protein